MMSVLLEAAIHGGLPPVIMGVFTLLCLLGALGWVIGMGSGRPNSR
ncbi:hypothetical protein [Tessaracoccus sp. OH4464_COT-324]|nr:hypothetical protein [Tessaracoccus sp. OH4464_COT-324]